MDTDDSFLDLLGLLIVFGLIAGVAILVAFGGETGPGNPHPAPPDADWNVSRINATHVQLYHEGGEAVDASVLELTVDGEARSPPWEGQVQRGDVGLVRAEDGSQVVLYWTGDDRVERLEVGNWTT